MGVVFVCFDKVVNHLNELLALLGFGNAWLAVFSLSAIIAKSSMIAALNRYISGAFR